MQNQCHRNANLKRRLVVDTEGLVLRAYGHPADIMDRDGVKVLLLHAADDLRLDIRSQFPRLRHVWLDVGDKDKDWIERTLGWSTDIVAHPPRRKKVWAPTYIPPEQIDWSKYGWAPPGFRVLPRRWVVERAFAWQSHSRRLSKDYDLLCRTSEMVSYVCMIRLVLRRLTRRG